MQPYAPDVMAAAIARMPTGAAFRRTSGRTGRAAISTPHDIAANAERVTAERSATGDLTVRLSGSWKLHDGIPSPRPVQDANREAACSHAGSSSIPAAIDGWDSSLPSFLNMLADYCNARGIPIARETLPDGVKRLMALAEAVPEAKDARASTHAGSAGRAPRRMGARLECRDQRGRHLRRRSRDRARAMGARPRADAPFGSARSRSRLAAPMRSGSLP